MATKTTFPTLKAGAPDWTAFSAVPEFVASKEDAKLKLTLPGDIRPTEKSWMGGIVPVAHVVFPGKGKGQSKNKGASLLLFFSPADDKKADAAYKKLLKQAKAKYKTKAPDGFDIVLSSPKVTHATLRKAITGKQPAQKSFAKAEIQIRMHFGKGKIISDAIGVELFAMPTILPDMFDPGHWYPMTECHSHWYFTSEKEGSKRFTYCFGGCPRPKRCHVAFGTGRFSWGWWTCWC